MNAEDQIIPAISLFSGSGMLDVGVERALARLGYSIRTVLYCEQNQSAVEVLKARIRDGLLPDAPIWPDVRTLPAARLRGLAGAVVGGFPCQDLSVAGKQSGFGKSIAGGGSSGDEHRGLTRSGLFFALRDVAVQCGAPLVFLENVPGIGSTACPADDGGFEPAAAVVAQALAEVGYLSRWLHLAAEDIGAPHGRERWWCVASLDDSASRSVRNDL